MLSSWLEARQTVHEYWAGVLRNTPIVQTAVPGNFVVFNSWSSLLSSGFLSSTMNAYCKVFKESWGEDYQRRDVFHKMRFHLNDPSAIATLMLVDGNNVAGFCWGRYNAKLEWIVEDAKHSESFGFLDNDCWQFLANDLASVSRGSTAYLAELGVIKEYRTGIASVQFLITHLVTQAIRNEVHELTMWTSKKSAVYPIALGLGLIPLLEFGDLVFMHSSDIRTEFAALQCLSPERLGRHVVRALSLYGKLYREIGTHVVA